MSLAKNSKFFQCLVFVRIGHKRLFDYVLDRKKNIFPTELTFGFSWKFKG